MRARHLEQVESPEVRDRLKQQRDEHWAERGERLKRFVRGEAIAGIWPQDLQPMLESLYGRYLRAHVAGKGEMVWALRALEDLAEMLGGQVQLGEGAMRRILERRLRKEDVPQPEQGAVA